jgi:hypothetical protein
MEEATVYRISFMNQGKVYEIYGRSVSHSELFGFIEVEELIFGERSKIVIDSSEEKLKSEFEGVKRTYIPIHSVVRIDEVEKAGHGRITSTDGKISQFPVNLIPPVGNDSK